MSGTPAPRSRGWWPLSQFIWTSKQNRQVPGLRTAKPSRPSLAASCRPHLRWAVDGGGSVWPGHSEGVIGGEVKFPSALVNQVMMAAAQRRQIVDIGQSLLQPVVGDVVDLGVFERHLTQRTGAIHDPE